MTRKINSAGLELIKAFEGLRLAAYLCPAKVWTVGWGSTGPHVKPGMTITLDEAETLLRSDLARFERAVDKAAPDASDNEFAAFVSLAFNIGIAGFNRSTALKRHLDGNKVGAANAILMWNKAGGVVLKGLVRRREAERALYLLPAKPAPEPPKPIEKPPETPVEAPVAPEATETPPEPQIAPLGCLAAVLGLFR
jgi:lysozyme